MTGTSKAPHPVDDNGSLDGSPDADRIVFLALSAAVTPSTDAFDLDCGPSSSVVDGLGFYALTDAELNAVWGEVEFEVTDYIVVYQPDQLF